jgi:hypothetical protein
MLASTGDIYTVAGTPPGSVTGAYHCGYSGDEGPAGSAQLNAPSGVAVDSAGDLFIADTHNCVIREVVPQSGTGPLAGTIYTVAGNGSCAYSGDGGPARSAAFAYPSAMAFDSSGDLFVLDEFRVRRIQGLMRSQAEPSPSSLAFPTKALGTANTLAVTVTDLGTVPTSISTVGISGANAADFVALAGKDSCAGNSIVANGGSCAINVTFTPTVAGSENATLTITDSAGTQSVMLSGAGMDYAIGAATGALTSAVATQGSTASYSLRVTAAGGNPGDEISVSLACSGAPSGATCSGPALPVVATTTTPGTFTVTVTTTAASMLRPPVYGPRRTLIPLWVVSSATWALFTLWFIRRGQHGYRRRLASFAFRLFAAPVLLVVFVAGCGGGEGSSGSGNGGTPAGTYTLTLTGTVNGGDAHTQILTLVVNAN